MPDTSLDRFEIERALERALRPIEDHLMSIRESLYLMTGSIGQLSRLAEALERMADVMKTEA